MSDSLVQSKTIIDTVVEPEQVKSELQCPTEAITAKPSSPDELDTDVDTGIGEVGSTAVPSSENASTVDKVDTSSSNTSTRFKILTEQPRKKNDEDKSGIYKSLAIKLKKELVKTRDDFQSFQTQSEKECNDLRAHIQVLNKSLEDEQRSHTDSCATIVTLEAKTKNLKQQLESTEADLIALQKDYENYKVQASRIMQQNTTRQSSYQHSFEEDKYKWLKVQGEQQTKQISALESQVRGCLEEKKSLLLDVKTLREQLDSANEKIKVLRTVESKYELVSRENENLKLAMKQFRPKQKDNLEHSEIISGTGKESFDRSEGDRMKELTCATITDSVIKVPGAIADNLVDEEGLNRASPVAFVKEDSQTNSSSSLDGSTSGYVHIKPTTFEIVSKSSMLDDAQNQIDNLTKAYLDSESTNSLLSDQVNALKEEIRRLQRGNDRLDLAENLEYLKNVLFKYLSLDNSQVEQKQRLIPVLSTVLRLSPDETGKLSSTISNPERSSMASSFFKL